MTLRWSCGPSCHGNATMKSRLVFDRLSWRSLDEIAVHSQWILAQWCARCCAICTTQSSCACLDQLEIFFLFVNQANAVFCQPSIWAASWTVLLSQHEWKSQRNRLKSQNFKIDWNHGISKSIEITANQCISRFLITVLTSSLLIRTGASSFWIMYIDVYHCK